DDSVEVDTSGGDGGTAEIGSLIFTGARAVGPGVVRDPTRRVADFTSLLDFFLPGTSSLDNSTALGFDPLNPGSGGGLGEQDYRRAPNPLILEPTLTPV